MASKRRIHTANEKKPAISKQFEELVDNFIEQGMAIVKQMEKEHPEWAIMSRCQKKMWALVDEEYHDEVNEAFFEMIDGLEKYFRKPLKS